MRVFSTFSGIGGFELGIKQVMPDAEFVGFSEIDKYAISIYKKHFKGVKNYGDITKINTDELPRFDCLVGGFPCQAFSIAGKRKGFNDTRGTLFFDLARILQAKQPKLFIFENVKGLLSHDSGRTFRTIAQTIAEVGYDCQWQVLNSKHHGVPQNRERVFIIGHLRGTPRPEVFPIRQSDAVPYKNEMSIKPINKPTHSNNRVYEQGGLSPALNTVRGGNRRPKIAIPVLTPDRATKRQNGRRFKTNGEPAFTVNTQDRHGVMLIPEATKKGYAEATVGDAINLSNPNSKTRRGRVSSVSPTLETSNQIHTIDPEAVRIRKLTPRECERLQGFADDWTKYGAAGELISDTQRYKCCGNAVTVNVVADIFNLIKKEDSNGKIRCKRY